MVNKSQVDAKRPLITFLLPLCCPDVLLDKLLSDLVCQSASFEWDVVIIDNANMSNDHGEIVKNINDDRIHYYQCNKSMDRFEMLKQGFEISKGKWVFLLSNNYVFLPQAVQKIGNLAVNVDKCTQKRTAYISMWYKTLRVNASNKVLAYKEVERNIRKLQNTTDGYKLIEVTSKYNIFGALGIIEPHGGALYLRNVFVKSKGFEKKNYPMENALWAAEIMKNYSICVSTVQYGLFVRMESIYTSRNELIKAVDIWTQYIDSAIEKSKSLKLIKNIKKNYIKYMYLTSLLGKHKSFGLSQDCFADYFGKFPNRICFTFWSVISVHFYEKYAEKQIKINDLKLSDTKLMGGM